MNRIEGLRALLSDAQQQYYRCCVKYNTESRGFPDSSDLHKRYRVIECLLYYRGWINSISNDLHAAMRCK
jgi:hypothetical protein